MSTCRDFRVEGVRSVGRPTRTWCDCVEKDMIRLGMKRVDAQDRAQWKVKIMRKSLTHVSAEKMTQNGNDDDDDDLINFNAFNSALQFFMSRYFFLVTLSIMLRSQLSSDNLV